MAQNIIFTQVSGVERTKSQPINGQRIVEDEVETDEEELEKSLLSYEQFDNRSAHDCR